MMRSVKEFYECKTRQTKEEGRYFPSKNRRRRKSETARLRAERSWLSGRISAQKRLNLENLPTRKARRCITSRWTSKEMAPTHGRESLPTAR